MITLVDLKKLFDVSNNVRMRLCDYVVDCVADAVEFARENSHPQPRCCSPSRHPEYALLRKFVDRLIKLSRPSIHAIVIALVYIDRLKFTGCLVADGATCERLALGTLLLATKYLSDFRIRNRDWIVAGLHFSRKEITQLEIKFLSALDYRLQVSDDKMRNYQRSICEAVASLHIPQTCLYHGCPRPMITHDYPPHHYARYSIAFKRQLELNSHEVAGNTLAKSRRNYSRIGSWFDDYAG
ncbi:hypothetical protein EDD16DRAFT_1702539 [Pisolithus croceorrhizus]|nr:hypothetical protein EDD16DRAFT_1702539 [Pisolithus croceorrhizus]KAI6166205.1 hypothetical protein EDD17DRAFT_43341 [Pisolithus thermaeus]